MSQEHASDEGSRSKASRNSPTHSNEVQIPGADQHDSTEKTVTESTSSSLSFRSVDFGQLRRDAVRYARSPEDAKQWLIGFGALRPDTNVSLHLVSVQHVDNDSGIKQYPSLLPVLSTLLDSWYDNAKVARSAQAAQSAQATQSPRSKDRKASEIGASPTLGEDRDLLWLFAYIRDYLSCHNAGFDEEDIVSLADSALRICKSAFLKIDVAQSMSVLYGLFSNYGCPDTILEPSLSVLCAACASMKQPLPVHTTDCISLILAGAHRVVAIDLLHTFVGGSFDFKSGREVNRAIGAAKILSKEYDTKEQRAIERLALDQLAASFLKAASGHVLPLDTGILGCCASFLDESRVAKTLSQEWTTFVAVISTCSRSKAETKIEPKSSPESANKSKTEIMLDTNAELVEQIKASLEKYWDKMSYDQKRIVYEYFMISPQDLTCEQAARVIQYLQASQLCWSDEKDWQKIFKFVEALIIDTKSSAVSRIQAIEVIAGPMKSADILISTKGSEETRSKGELAVSRSFQVLQELLTTEDDETVLASLVSTLTELLTIRSLERLYVKSVTESILSIAMRADSPSKSDSKRAVYATDSLIQMFLRAFHFPNTRALHAFTALVKIAGLECPNSEARIAAMKLLFRIRCDSEGFVYIQYASESEYIAIALCRTVESAEIFRVEEPVMDQRHSRTNTASPWKARSSRRMWMYPGPEPLPEKPRSPASIALFARGHGPDPSMQLNLARWIETLVGCLQKDTDWETYSYVLVHLGAQLSNVELFKGSLVQVNFLRRVLCDQIGNNSFHEPPAYTGLKKSDIAICVFNILTPLIAYATMAEQFTRNDSDELVRAFLQGVGGSWEGTSRGCIHSLSICCLEIPASVARSYPTILDKMLKNITQVHLSMHILEFLAELARLPEEHSNIRDEEIRNIFGICIRVVEIARDRKTTQATIQPTRLSTPSARHSGVSTKRVTPYRAAMLADIGVPQYAFALAYHTMIFWFLSLKLETRANHVSWIIDRLIYKAPSGEDVIDEQSQVFVDMMQRTTFSDLGETVPHPDFAGEGDGTITSSSWLVGLSIITVDTAGVTGRSQITKRQASGTTHSIYQQFTADTPYHHVPITTQTRPEGSDPLGSIAMLPQHVLLQITTTAAPIGLSNQPIPLPKDDMVKRALMAFDRNPTVDGYKMGVIYVGEGQAGEAEILANTIGSSDFYDFLNGLGTKMQLENAQFNTQGLLDKQDGLSAYAWRDRVSEIVYHVPVLMPTNLEDDPHCVNKKRHIGNDFVNIIFNRSGNPFDFNTFPSEFNYVNIVVTPASRASKKEADEDIATQNMCERARMPGGKNEPWVPKISTYPQPKYYQVHVLTAPGFPSISPASDPKIISATQLPSFVRLIGLNACVFCTAWVTRNSDTDYPSSWRARLQEIRRLRDRVVQRAAAAAPEPVRGGPLYRDRGGERAGRSLYPEDRSALTSERKVVDYDAVGAEGEALNEQLDFSSWTT